MDAEDQSLFEEFFLLVNQQGEAPDQLPPQSEDEPEGVEREEELEYTAFNEEKSSRGKRVLSKYGREYRYDNDLKNEPGIQSFRCNRRSADKKQCPGRIWVKANTVMAKVVNSGHTCKADFEKQGVLIFL